MVLNCLIKLESFSKNDLKIIAENLNNFAISNNMQITKESYLPQRKKIYTVLRSPHIDKKSREQFELRSYRRAFKLYNNSNPQIQLFVEYLKESVQLPVSIKIEFYNYETFII